MCGLGGIYLKTGQVGESTLNTITQRLSHRGPDGVGTWREGRVGLIHVRLAIIDLAGGQQPLYNEDRSLVLIANGEIYNYIELRQELEALGHRFATHSDCETILHAYEAYGDSFLDHLHGMFAFALYDKNTGDLILARDRLGIKPLFISSNSDGVYFASEIKGILPLLGKPEVEPFALAQYLQSNYSSGRATLFKGVERVLPGEVVKISSTGDITRRIYWSPNHVMPSHVSLNDALAQYDVLMEQVMREHMRTDVPFGLFLSGGVDSSVLLALLSRYADEPIRTLSVGFPGTGVRNELAVAASTATKFSARHDALELHQDTLLKRLPHCVWAADELMADYASLPLSALAERAGAELKVVFSGEGGDEVFAGYGRYRPHPLKALLGYLRAPGTQGFRSKGLFSEVGLCSAELSSAMQHWRAPLIEAWNAAPATWSKLQRMQAADMATWLPDDLLVKADRILMAFGVEGRVPFLDHRVVEFGLGLPDEYKIDGKNGKRFLKQWAEQYFPREQLWGKKSGFTVPVNEWLSGDLLDKLETHLPQNTGIQRWFNADAITKLIQRQRSHRDRSQPLWAMLQFAIWHRMFIEGDGVRPPTEADLFQYITS